MEAAETLFVPVGVRNNSEGDDDARVRERFKEPAWNNPVVRFLDVEGKDIGPRLTDEWSQAQLAQGMIETLAASKKAVPRWLELVRDEAVARRRGLERAVFSMH